MLLLRGEQAVRCMAGVDVVERGQTMRRQRTCCTNTTKAHAKMANLKPGEGQQQRELCYKARRSTANLFVSATVNLGELLCLSHVSMSSSISAAVFCGPTSVCGRYTLPSSGPRSPSCAEPSYDTDLQATSIPLKGLWTATTSSTCCYKQSSLDTDANTVFLLRE